MTGPEPGWYARSDEPGTAEFWDGRAWTGETRAAEGADPEPAPANIAPPPTGPPLRFAPAATREGDTEPVSVPVPGPAPAAPARFDAPPIAEATPESKDRTRLYLVLALGALFIVAAVGGGIVASMSGGTSHSTAQPASRQALRPAAGSTPIDSSTSVTTGASSDPSSDYRAFLVGVAQIVDTSAPARDQLQQVLSAAGSCALSSRDGSTQLAPIIQNRQSALDRITQLRPPSRVGRGAELVDALRRAVQQSLADDHAYAQWISSAGASGCPVGAAPDTTSTAALKQQVLTLYNGEAATYGLPAETRTGF